VSHGVLAIGGMVSMALGSLMLFDSPEVGFRVSWWVIAPTVGLTAGLFLFVVAAGVRALGQPPATGAEGLIGKTATVRERLGPEGQVMVSGEIWRAVAEGEALEPGAQVRIVAVDGLTLKVAKAEAKGGVA
jgi:membrane-bound serine protease (ClpP class)